MKKNPPVLPSLTLDQAKQLLITARQREQMLTEESAILRSQVMQLQKISEYLEQHYYNPMTRGFWKRLWFAMWVKKQINRERNK